MKVAVITPYYREDTATLEYCNWSVKRQTHPCTHIMVADGHPVDEEIFQRNTQHIILPECHGDYGDTPRLIGTISAYAQGFDAICWLDADNDFEATHVEELVELATQEVVDVVTATRYLRRWNHSLLGVCSESDGENFCDTNCYLLTRPAMKCAMEWGFKPKREAVIGDRYVWNRIKEAFPRRAHNPKPTVNYETMIATHYLERGEQPPEEARIIVHNGVHFENRLYWDYVNGRS